MSERKSILVTGGTGLVGSHLLYSLTSAGHKPMAIHRKTSNIDFVRKIFAYYSDNSDELFQNIIWIEADILDNKAVSRVVKECGQVYHCAAVVSFDSSTGDNVIEINTISTKNIVSACLESDGIKLCHVSSVAALGAESGGRFVNESHQWNNSTPKSSYAVSKYKSEEQVRDGIRKGLNAVIVNPSVIFGPGDWSKGSSSFFYQIDKGMPFYTSGVTGYVDVHDVVQSMINLMNSPVRGERFIISSENLSYKDVFTMISNTIGARKPFLPIPKVLLYPASSLLRLTGVITGKKNVITPEILRSASSKVYFDNSKLIQTTGIQFITIKDSVEDTGKLFLREKALQQSNSQR